MVKKALIVHAWGSGPEEHWYREEEKALKELGFEVFLPQLPGGMWPKRNEWLSVLNSIDIDDEAIIIGHSLGVPAILHFLQEVNKKVGKVFFVAGFGEDLGIEETKSFFEKPFDLKKIKGMAGEFYILNETNDPYVPVERGKELAKFLEGEFIEVQGNIHFDKMDLNIINSRL